MIDYVITYVDGSDPAWIKEFNKYTESKIIPGKSERFRSWDNLKYNLRLVQENLPFIRNVYLVVASETQVPAWVDRERVKVVLHKDIIPERFLPTFCSTTIEMFLGFIPGLSETFIYANDDTFAIKRCEEADFFIGGKPVLNFGKSRAMFDKTSQYEMQLGNSLFLAGKAKGEMSHYSKLVPKHTINPLTVSSYKKVWDICGEDIEKQCTRFRTDNSYNQYLFSYYDYLNNNFASNPNTTTRYINFGGKTINETCSFIKHSLCKLLCINDSGVVDFEVYKKKINQVFDDMVPSPSKYEISDDSRKNEPLKVHLYTLCYNELPILPFIADYWKTIADEVFVLDNGSTDGSVEYMEKLPHVHVIPFKSDGFNDKIHQDLKNSVWKASRGRADFVVVCDLDEVMYSDEGIRNILQEMKDNNETICQPLGYNVYSDTFPEYDGRPIWEHCNEGIRDHSFDKVTIFNPVAITEMNYTPGAHKCTPRGEIKWRKAKDVLLLHYKFLSLEYVLRRYREYKERLSTINKKKRYGIQYTRDEEHTRNVFNFKRRQSAKIINTGGL